ncbi:MAG: hypothetical protein AAF772_14370, partial [Acidobacteriota bacterium]
MPLRPLSTSAPPRPARLRLRAGLIVGLGLMMLAGAAAFAESGGGKKNDGALPPLAEKLADATRLDGFVTVHVDRRAGKVWLEVPPADDDGIALRMLMIDAQATAVEAD